MSQSRYKRILLKLSGESLGSDAGIGVDPAMLDRLAREVGAIADAGTEVGIVLGGGNIFRGAELAAAGLDRVAGDQMGTLATVMNGIAMRDALERCGRRSVLFSSTALPGVAAGFSAQAARAAIGDGAVAVLAGGTGNPFFTTDTAACLRALEIQADVVVKGTRVAGVFTADPETDPDAQLIKHVDWDQVLDQRLGVMDLTAICLCRENKLPIRVYNMLEEGLLARLAGGEDVGTLVDGR